MKSKGFVGTLGVTILPPFFHLFSLTWLHVPLVSHATYPMHLACASKSWDLFSLTLHSCTLFYLPMPLFGSLRLCWGFLLHFSDSFVYDSLVPFSTIHLPHLVRFLIPVYVITFHLHQRPYASFLDPVLYLALFTVSPFVPSFRLRPSPVYNP
jgi:hypothetical protein